LQDSNDHERRVPHSSQLYRDEWDIRAKCANRFLSCRPNFVISTEGAAEVEKPVLRFVKGTASAVPESS